MLFKKGFWTLSFLTLSPFVFAQPAVAAINSGDTAWMMVSTALVLLMTPGLAFFYAGMVRPKNAGSTTFQNFAALGVISLVWAVCGYSLAFGKGGNFIGDFSMAFLKGVGNEPCEFSPVIPHSVFMAFQCMFAVITPALITGSFAERIKFKPYIVFLILWSLLVYSPVAHWVWGGGFLMLKGVKDFAGGMVVHMTAGFSALAAAFVFGRRSDHGKQAYLPHNTPLVCLGTALLWFGWFGFNAGSALAANESAANAFVTTHFATATALVVWVSMDWAVGKPNLVGACVGAVVGLVAITPAAGFVTLSSSIIIGAAAAAISYVIVKMVRGMKIDDSLDVFACHGIGGLTGSILTGALAKDGGGMAQVMIQLAGAAWVLVYSFGVTFLMLKILDVYFGLRPTEQDELEGLDETQHDEPAYSHPMK